MTVRIILADDHKIMREGIHALLEHEPGIEVIGEAEGGESVVRLVLEHRPDVVIMDITMPDMNGIEATRRILADLPDTKIIALSMHSDRRFVREMLAAGAAGYLLKDAAYDELRSALNAVSRNQTYLSPALDEAAQDQDVPASAEPAQAAKSAGVLSRREREILQLIAEGKSTRHIALSLRLSEKTVAAHRSHIMHKLKVKSIAELTKYAIREGLTCIEL
jgi:DNA-binding NarL/FixJ family response regulator